MALFSGMQQQAERFGARVEYDEIVEFSELEEFIDFPVKNYSSGMQAKLGFSIATVVNPDILIIDEILSVGDVKFQKKSSDKIKSLMGSGTTVLLVSHSIQQIRNLCDKALWIEHGKVVAYDEVNKVCDAYLKAAESATKDELKNIKLIHAKKDIIVTIYIICIFPSNKDPAI